MHTLTFPVEASHRKTKHESSAAPQIYPTSVLSSPVERVGTVQHEVGGVGTGVVRVVEPARLATHHPAPLNRSGETGQE